MRFLVIEALILGYNEPSSNFLFRNMSMQRKNEHICSNGKVLPYMHMTMFYHLEEEQVKLIALFQSSLKLH